jgi:glycosyltransferase involved in cell wall biosynthesis
VKIVYLAIVDVTAEAAQTRHVFEICENWQRLGHEVTLFVPDVPGNPSQNLSTKLVKVKAFGLKQSFLLTLVYNLGAVFYIIKHLISNSIDIVYTRHSRWEFIPILCLKPFAISYIIEINGLDSEQKRLYGLPEWKIRISEWFDGICYGLADGIIAVTDEIRNFLLNRYPTVRHKTHVISNGANVEISRPMPRESACRKLGLDPGYTYLVFVGSMKKWHGIENAILASKFLIGSYPKLKLLLVGDGHELTYFKAMVDKEALRDKVVFAGKVKYDQVPFYIGVASLCLAPFNTERNDLTGLSPLKIFEYMACGKPIITTKVGGLERIINQHKCGLAVEPDNPDALVKGIKKLLSNPNLSEELGRNGRHAAEIFYSWSTISQSILTLIQSVK